jgi:hypothetical protein
MNKLLILGKLLVLFIFVAALFLLGTRAEFIRTKIAQQFGFSRKAVAGAKTSLESEMKQNMVEYADKAKDSAMNIKVGDIINTLSRVKKIGEDANTMKDEVVKQVNDLLKK